MKKGISLLVASGLIGLSSFQAAADGAVTQGSRTVASTDRAHRACGLIGSVAQRIADCGREVFTSKGFYFTLVTRDRSGNEVWRDDDSSKFWGDQISRRWMNYNEVVHFNGTGKEYQEYESVCDSSDDIGGGLHDLNWKLPSREDALEAESHGFREVLPNLVPGRWDLKLLRDGGFWVSGFKPQGNGIAQLNYAYIFQTFHGQIWSVPRSTGFQVRCIAIE